ncbi:MAG TPA: DUF4358 domain-containing protein [Bacillota bacterium]|nr:DUF4358 domain-containing protein [Bacillota bacterium]
MKRFLRLFCCSLFLVILFLGGCIKTSDPSATPSTPEEPAAAQVDLAQLAASIMEIGKFPEMLELSEPRIDKFFDIDLEQLDTFSIFLCAEPILSDEIVFLRLNNAQDMDTVKEEIEARQATQKASFDSYLPKEGKKLDNALWFSYDTDLLYIVAPAGSEAAVTAAVEAAYHVK